MFKRILIPGLALLVSLGLMLVILELGSFVLASTDLLKMSVPSYSLQKRSSLNPQQGFWADRSPEFGVWHTPGASYRHVKSCFDVEYRANSHGQRDPERDKQSSEARFVVLGDSMVEGFGVARGQRMTDRLEAKLGREFLNFGTSGDFGPTQYHLLYRHLARDFRHDAVLIGLLPANDFRDDDIEFGRRVYPDRYRPYWVGESPDYELVYFKESLDAEVPEDALDRGLGLRSLLHSFSYAYHAYRYAMNLLARSDAPAGSGYYDFTPMELDRMKHSLSLIRADAGDRPIVLLLFPVESDLVRNAGADETPLTRELRRFAKTRNMQVLDLLPYFSERSEDWNRYFLSCDGHWSAYGHEVAAEAVEAFLVENELLLKEPVESASRPD